MSIQITVDQLYDAQSGCQETISLILELLHPITLSVIRKMKTHPNDIEDVVQDSVIRVLKCIEDFNPKRSSISNFANYCADAILDMLRDRYSNMQSRRNLEQNHLRHNPFSGWQQEIELKDSLAQLSPMKQQLVKEHFGLGGSREYSINQLSARHAVSDRVIKDQLREAFETLRRSW